MLMFTGGRVYKTILRGRSLSQHAKSSKKDIIYWDMTYKDLDGSQKAQEHFDTPAR